MQMPENSRFGICQGIAVGYYGFTLGNTESEALRHLHFLLLSMMES